MLKFDREKYFLLLKTQGANAALTQLQADMEKWEQEVFETEKGYQPELFQDLKQARDFSRELWETSIQKS